MGKMKRMFVMVALVAILLLVPAVALAQEAGTGSAAVSAGIDWNVWAVVIANVLTGVIIMAVIYVTTKNFGTALVEGIGVIAGNMATMNTLEAAYTNVMPDEWEPAVSALINALQRQAEGTASEADDALLDFLERATDGLPNDGSAKIVAG